MRWLVSGSLAVSVLAGVSCKLPLDEVLDIRHARMFIIGERSDIVPVTAGMTIPQQVRSASVLVTTKLADRTTRFCSGTIVAADEKGGRPRVLTNHHCFARQSADGSTVYEDLVPEACQETSVYFDFTRENASKSSQRVCLKGSLRTYYDADLAVFELDGEAISVAPLEVAAQDVDTVGADALVVHFPGIEQNMVEAFGNGLKLPVMSATINDCRILGGFRNDEFALDRALPFAIKHSCDLVHGSSGSALIDAETSKIIGVNWGGIEIKRASAVTTVNAATRASFVKEFLDGDISALDQRRQEASALAARSTAPRKKVPASGSNEPRCGVASTLPVASPKAHWSGAWMLQNLLAEEYLAVMGALEKRFPNDRRALARDEALMVYRRARVAWSLARESGWRLWRQDLLGEKLESHARFITRNPGASRVVGRPFLTPFLAKAPSEPSMLGDDAMGLVAASFSSENQRASWMSWQKRLVARDSVCASLGERDPLVEQTAARLRPLMARASQASPVEIVGPLKKESAERVTCLAWRMHGAFLARPERREMSPLPLMEAMNASGASQAGDAAFMAVWSGVLFSAEDFARSLQMMVQIQDREAAWRLPYEIAQRVYAFRQMGQGEVALQHM